MKFFQNNFKKIINYYKKEEKRYNNNIINIYSLLIKILLLNVNISFDDKNDLNFFKFCFWYFVTLVLYIY